MKREGMVYRAHSLIPCREPARVKQTCWNISFPDWFISSWKDHYGATLAAREEKNTPTDALVPWNVFCGAKKVKVLLEKGLGSFIQ